MTYIQFTNLKRRKLYHQLETWHFLIDYIDCYLNLSTMDEYHESVLNAKIFANEFFKICSNYSPSSRDSDVHTNHLRLKHNKNVADFLCRVRNAIVRGNCSEKTFQEKVIKMSCVVSLDLEIWWYLMKSEIISPDDLLSVFDGTEFWNISKNLSSSLFKNIFLELEPGSCFTKDINTDFLELLLIHEEKCKNNGSQSLVYNNFLQHISQHEINEDNTGFLKNTDILVDSVNVSLLNTSKANLFLFDFIRILLQGKSISLKNILYKNEHFLKYEKSVFSKNSKILSFINVNDIISFLKSFLCNNSNPLIWDNFFIFLTLMISNYEQVNLFKQLKTLIQYLLEEALKIFNENLLLYVFILVRHCSYPPTPYFSSYLQWFSSTFSSDSVHPINTKEKSIFFMNFLTSIAEYDSPYYMKIHINKVPWVPVEYQLLVSDYVKLIKTRLVDLNESFELGLFDNMMTNSSAEFDVETVLDIFKNTNEIPNCVLEASLFCKSYYEKKFLVTLLSKFEGENSVRHKLITKLSNLGKVPHLLLLQYKKIM